MSELALLSRQEIEGIIAQAVDKTVNARVRPTPLIMNKAQLCAYLDKPLSTINRWMKEGLPYRKEGKDYPEFYKPHVDEWLERRFSKAVESEVVQ